MITLKQKYNSLVKRIWRPQIYNYAENFQKAISNSKRLGIENDYEYFGTKPMELDSLQKQELITQILYQIYSVERFGLEDMAQKCTVRSVDLKYYLKNQFNIDSYITVGNVYTNKLKFCYENFATLKKRLVDKMYDEPFKFHTWLTLENLDVLDITILPNIFLEEMLIGRDIQNQYQNMVWLNEKEQKEKKVLVYEPKLVGEDYLRKIRTPIKIFTFIKP